MAYKYEYKKSPNYTQGRRSPITTVVIHWMVGTLKSTDAVFANPRSGVSAHYGIENNNVHQYVDEDNTAWHAISANPFSIGIEHSAAPGRSASEATYKTSAELIAQICTERKIPVENIQPHCKYVQTRCPGTDANGTVDEPGGMDIGRIKRDVKRILGSKPAAKPPAKPTAKPTAKPRLKSLDAIAREVIAGKWGNNPTRATKLRKAGYNPGTVQIQVNRILRRK